MPNTSSEFASKLSTGIEKGEEAVKAAVSQIGPTAEKAYDKAVEVYDQAEKAVSDSMTQVRAVVRRNPLEAIAIGFGVGCLVGFLIRSR